MKESSRWNLLRGRRPGGAAGLVALGRELDGSPGVGCSLVFLQPRRVAARGRLAAFREKDPSVVRDYFEPDSAQDVTCLETLWGGGITGRRGRVWERTEVIFSRRRVGSSSQLYPFHVFIVSLHLCLQRQGSAKQWPELVLKGNFHLLILFLLCHFTKVFSEASKKQKKQAKICAMRTFRPENEEQATQFTLALFRNS